MLAAMAVSWSAFPSLQRRVDAPLTKWIRSEKGADGVVAHKRCFGMHF